MKEELFCFLSELELGLSPEQLEQLAAFGAGVAEKNRVMNLTAITAPEQMAQLHFLDCLALRNALDFSDASVIDVGCGAGFPGVPLKIAVPSMHLTLLDSLNKRIAWLREEMLPELGIAAECVCARAEEFAAQRREAYDFAVSRAVARLNMLVELSLPYVREGGAFVAMKGAQGRQEADEARRAITVLGGELEQIYEYPVAGAVHCAVVIRKTHPTPRQYPRRFAKIKQQPL